MNDFLNDFLAYKPEGDAAIWKNRADTLATVIVNSVPAHPFYSKEKIDIRYLAYFLTYSNQFLKFYNEMMTNYPFNAKTILLPEVTSLITFMSAHDGLNSDGGEKMFYNAAIVLRDYIKDEVFPKTNAYFLDYTKTKEENLETFISLYDREKVNVPLMVRKQAIAMADSIISFLIDRGEREDKKEAMLFSCDYETYINGYHKALASFFSNEENEKFLEEQLGEQCFISAETISKMANFLISVDFNGHGNYRDIFTTVSKGVIDTLLSPKESWINSPATHPYFH